MVFKEQEIKAYHSIQAPRELYDKVMAAQKPKRHWGRYLTGVAAACLVLVAAAGFFFRGGAPGITVNGQRLENSVVYYDVSPASDMRSSPVLTVPVELNLSKPSKITVTHGLLTAEDTEAAKELTASGSVTLNWEITREADIPLCEMHIDNGKEITTITLKYEHSEITLTKKGD